jgi:hypothetical protein
LRLAHGHFSYSPCFVGKKCAFREKKSSGKHLSDRQKSHRVNTSSAGEKILSKHLSTAAQRSLQSDSPRRRFTQQRFTKLYLPHNCG